MVLKTCAISVLFALVSGEATELTQKTFDEALDAQNMLVKFYAPWCGHCQKMKPDWDKLSDIFANNKVLIADVDCTTEEELCQRFGVQGYPTLKYFKDASRLGEDYEGGRDLSDLQSFVSKELDQGPACSLGSKEECDAETLVLLEESENMSKGERSTKIAELEGQVTEKEEAVEDDIEFDEDQIDEIKLEVKEIKNKIRIMKLGGDKLEQLLSDADFRAECESTTCVLAFLPDILDSGAAGRNEYLKTVSSARNRARGENIPVSFMWLQGGDQFEIEEKLSLQFGWPAVIVINLKKDRYGVHRGKSDLESIMGFLRGLMIGKVPLHPLPKGLEKFRKVQPWDGKDGELPQEEL